MNRSTLVVAAVLSFAACNAQNGVTPAPSTARLVARADHRASWMSANVAPHNLLYVTDSSTGDVYAYGYPKMVLEGTLTGFNNPLGACVDALGNVWIVNAGTNGNEPSQLLEYAHGGTSPIATLTAPGYVQYCAVNKKTGDLAATSPTAGVFVWSGATGTPATYTPTNIFQTLYCAYDSKGDLYVDGSASPNSAAPAYAVLRKGSSTFSAVTLNPTPNEVLGIQNNDGNLAVGDDSDGQAINLYSVSKGIGTKVGATPLTGASNAQTFFIQSFRVVIYDDVEQTLVIYPYPGGGSPTKTVAQPGNVHGMAVSRRV